MDPSFPIRGFTLVEIMVALTIGLIILTAVAGVFATSRATYQTNEGLARLQENARFAMEFFTRDVRMAGYMGCLADVTQIHNNLNGGGGFPNDFTVAIQGFEANGTAPGSTYNITATDPNPVGVNTNNWGPTLDAALQDLVIPGTDVLVIRRTNEASFQLVPPYNNSAQIFLSPNTSFQDGDILIVTDCSKASVFQATNRNADGSNVAHAASGTPGNDCPNWGQPGCTDPDPQLYQDGAELSQATTSIFYVGQGASGSPALFMTQLSGGALQPLELVEGVVSLQILYGVDTTPPPAPLDVVDQYMTAFQVNALTTANPDAGWPRVVSVRISLLVRTVNAPGTQADQSLDTRTYNVSGATIDPVNDMRRRRVFTTTIQLRNRIRS